MIDELAFSEKMLEVGQVRCSGCGQLKNASAGDFCLNCYKESRDKRMEKYKEDAMMFGREFFLDILDWIQLYMEPQDIFTAGELEAWAVENGWVPEEVQNETE